MSICLKVQIIYHPFLYVSSFWYSSTVISFLAFDRTDVNVPAADGRLLLSTTSLAMSCAVYVCVWDKKENQSIASTGRRSVCQQNEKNRTFLFLDT